MYMVKIIYLVVLTLMNQIIYMHNKKKKYHNIYIIN